MRKYTSVNRSYGSQSRNSSGYSRRPSGSSSKSAGSGSGHGGYGRPSNSGRGRKNNSIFRNKLLWIIIAAAVAVVIIVVCVASAGTEAPEEEKRDGIIAQNVTIEGINVGGMDVQQATAAVAEIQQELTDGAVIQLEVPAGNVDSSSEETSDDTEQLDVEDSDEAEGEVPTTDLTDEPQVAEIADALVPENMQIVSYTADKSGIYADADGAVQKALEYTESLETKTDEEKQALAAYDIPMLFAVDDLTLSSSLTADSEEWNIEAKSASFALDASYSEEDLTTSATPVTQPAEDGLSVDVESFVTQICDRVDQQNLEEIFIAPTVVTQADSGENIDEYDVIGQYSTEYSSKQENRSYNIWKISSILNGEVIQPGETFSVNEVVGPRTEENGWKLASGIENGMFTDQAGGGICQVSTTLYIASLKAELKIVERKHHTIPSTYVPLGLDATISTDSPDLKIENNTDYPVHIAVLCDVSDGTVAVKLYGIKDRDYYLRFESQVIETTPAIETKYIADSTVPEGTVVEEGSTRDGYTVEVYKVWYDKETEQETDRKRIYTDTYKALGKTVKYNPATPPAEMQTDITVPTEDPTTPVEPSPEPDPEPTPEPTPAEGT